MKTIENPYWKLNLVQKSTSVSVFDWIDLQVGELDWPLVFFTAGIWCETSRKKILELILTRLSSSKLDFTIFVLIFSRDLYGPTWRAWCTPTKNISPLSIFGEIRWKKQPKIWDFPISIFNRAVINIVFVVSITQSNPSPFSPYTICRTLEYHTAPDASWYKINEAVVFTSEVSLQCSRLERPMVRNAR